MLKASPQNFRSRSIASASPHKTAEVRHPLDGIAKRRRLGWGLRHPMNSTIERLPFIGRQQHATGHLRNRASQHGGIQNPPRHHTIKRQTTLEALGRLELRRFNAAATFQNPVHLLTYPLIAQFLSGEIGVSTTFEALTADLSRSGRVDESLGGATATSSSENSRGDATVIRRSRDFFRVVY
jgi:hypothetical protein